jgi:hypothetical protein
MLPREDEATPRQLYVQSVLYASDVESGGAALRLVPRSHRHTYAALAAATAGLEGEALQAQRQELAERPWECIARHGRPFDLSLSLPCIY